jgi:hypothetical protein
VDEKVGPMSASGAPSGTSCETTDVQVGRHPSNPASSLMDDSVDLSSCPCPCPAHRTLHNTSS